MRVISSAAATRVRPEVRRSRAVNLELLGMIGASIVVAFGIALVFAGKLARIGEDAPVAAQVQLSSAQQAQSVEPLLTMFPTVYERQTAVEADRSARRRRNPVSNTSAVSRASRSTRQRSAPTSDSWC